MSHIAIYKENISRDINQPITYSMIDYAILQIDLLGNTYLKYNDTYYIVSIDQYCSSGVELTKIKNPNIFRKNLIEGQNLKKGMKSGVIKSNNTTLRGKAHESINDMTDEEKNEYMDKNNYMINDDGCIAKKYFWVKYDEDDEPLEGETDDGFYLNGVVDESDINESQGIVHSDLLSLVPGTFEVILIQGDINSKYIISNIARIDGYYTNNLTVYTSGKLRTNFIEVTKLAILCLDTNTGDLFTTLCTM